MDNAIWLCQSCAKLIDTDTARFSVELLRGWKISAEASALREIAGAMPQESFPQPVGALHTPIPKIAGLAYEAARERLIDAGWQPQFNHWTYGGASEFQSGNGLYFWEKGFHEIIHASGTGLGHCSFGFVDVYGTRLIVVTAGEVDKDEHCSAMIWRWYFPGDDDS